MNQYTFLVLRKASLSQLLGGPVWSNAQGVLEALEARVLEARVSEALVLGAGVL